MLLDIAFSLTCPAWQ